MAHTLGEAGAVFHDTGTALHLANIYDWVGDAPDWLPDRPDMYEKRDGRMWAASAGNKAHSVPRSSYDAICHIVSYLEFPQVHPVVDWTNLGMAFAARAYGVDHPQTTLIPPDVPGHPGAGVRQFRWLRKHHPELTVTAPGSDSFGWGVPIGAVLYWDDPSGSTGLGRVGIAAGYRNGLLMQFTAVAEKYCTAAVGGNHTPECRHAALMGAPSMGAVGWALPTFFAPPQEHGMRLWEGFEEEFEPPHRFSRPTLPFEPGASGTVVPGASERRPYSITVKGTKASEADLPATGNRLGDLWMVDGTAHIWDGSAWYVEFPPPLPPVASDVQVEPLSSVPGLVFIWIKPDPSSVQPNGYAVQGTFSVDWGDGSPVQTAWGVPPFTSSLQEIVDASGKDMVPRGEWVLLHHTYKQDGTYPVVVSGGELLLSVPYQVSVHTWGITSPGLWKGRLTIVGPNPADNPDGKYGSWAYLPPGAVMQFDDRGSYSGGPDRWMNWNEADEYDGYLYQYGSPDVLYPWMRAKIGPDPHLYFSVEPAKSLPAGWSPDTLSGTVTSDSPLELVKATTWQEDLDAAEGAPLGLSGNAYEWYVEWEQSVAPVSFFPSWDPSKPLPPYSADNPVPMEEYFQKTLADLTYSQSDAWGRFPVSRGGDGWRKDPNHRALEWRIDWTAVEGEVASLSLIVDGTEVKREDYTRGGATSGDFRVTVADMRLNAPSGIPDPNAPRLINAPTVDLAFTRANYSSSAPPLVMNVFVRAVGHQFEILPAAGNAKTQRASATFTQIVRGEAEYPAFKWTTPQKAPLTVEVIRITARAITGEPSYQSLGIVDNQGVSHWDGSKWVKDDPTPLAAPPASPVKGQYCVAGGGTLWGNTASGTLMQFDGTSWRAVPISNTAPEEIV